MWWIRANRLSVLKYVSDLRRFWASLVKSPKSSYGYWEFLVRNLFPQPSSFLLIKRRSTQYFICVLVHESCSPKFSNHDGSSLKFVVDLFPITPRLPAILYFSQTLYTKTNYTNLKLCGCCRMIEKSLWRMAIEIQDFPATTANLQPHTKPSFNTSDSWSQRIASPQPVTVPLQAQSNLQ
jgi:hypothetical protein